MSKPIAIVLVILGFMAGMAGVNDILMAKMIFQQMAGLLEILIGIVMVLGGLILDKIPSNRNVVERKNIFPENLKEDSLRNQKYSGSTFKPKPVVAEEVKKSSLSGLSKPACERKYKI